MSTKVNLHTGVGTTTHTPPKAPIVTPTNGGFLDFLVAIAALIMMINAHKFAKQFLDYLLPGGGGGKGLGSLMSGIVEGAGMEMGWSAMKKGGQVVKTAGGMAASGGIAGLASAMKYSKDTGLLGKDGAVGSMLNKTKSATSGALGLYPPGLPSGKDIPKLPPDPTQFTMRDPVSGTDGSSGGGFGMSFGPSASSGSSSASPSGALFDGGSMRNGAATQIRPSAKSKLNDLKQEHEKGTVSGAMKAGFGGALNRIKSDAKHKATGKRGYAGVGMDEYGNQNRSANNILGVASQEFGGHREDQQLARDAFVPGKHLMDEADQGDLFALTDVAKIGQHQADMEQGMQWLEQGQSFHQKLMPEYESAQKEVEASASDVDTYGIMKSAYEAKGMTATPEYQEIESRYTAAVTRKQAAESILAPLSSQKEQAETLMRRGDDRVRDSQDAISKINWSWKPEKKQNSARLIQKAQARGNRPSLSGLGQAPNHHSKRSKNRT